LRTGQKTPIHDLLLTENGYFINNRGFIGFMGRQPKLTITAVRAAARDRRQGMTWQALSIKYNVAVNTIRKALSEYSTEFQPQSQAQRSEQQNRLTRAETEIEQIKAALKKRFNLHI